MSENLIPVMSVSVCVCVCGKKGDPAQPATSVDDQVSRFAAPEAVFNASLEEAEDK